MHRYLSLDALFERYQSLSGYNTGNTLQLVVEQRHELLIVTGIEFEKHRVGAGGEVALDDLGNFLQLGDNLAVHGAALEGYADVGAGVVAQHFGIDIVAGADNDFHLDQALDALVDGGARNATFNGDVLGGDARVAYDDTQDFTIQIVNSIHAHNNRLFKFFYGKIIALENWVSEPLMNI